MHDNAQYMHTNRHAIFDTTYIINSLIKQFTQQSFLIGDFFDTKDIFDN